MAVAPNSMNYRSINNSISRNRTNQSKSGSRSSSINTNNSTNANINTNNSTNVKNGEEGEKSYESKLNGGQ